MRGSTWAECSSRSAIPGSGRLAHFLLPACSHPAHAPRMPERDHVTVIIPAYNEEATIADVVRDFRSRSDVDEVLVVDNNCKDRTAEFALAAGARVVSEAKPGYGCALRGGMDAAGDGVLVLVEADGSFKALDLPKFLAYLEPDTLVMGTRTTSQMVDQAANMLAAWEMGNCSRKACGACSPATSTPAKRFSATTSTRRSASRS